MEDDTDVARPAACEGRLLENKVAIITGTSRGTMAAEADRGLIRPGEAGRSPAQRTLIGHQPFAAGPPGPAPTARGPHQPTRVDRHYAIVMLAAAATFGIASYLHLDGRIPLGFTTITGEHFGRASVPEAVIGAVLAVGAVVVAVAPGRARTAALGATGFAAVGVLAGIGFVLTSSRPHIAADLAYHLTMLLVLLAGLVVLVRTDRVGQQRAGTAPGGGPDREGTHR
jgi:hypothetical protein